MDYRQLTPVLSTPTADTEPPTLPELERELKSVFDAYQASRFGFAAGRTPSLLADAIHATRQYDGDELVRANEMLALSYQAAASVITKLVLVAHRTRYRPVESGIRTLARFASPS